MHVNHHACMCLASSFQRQLGSSRALSKVLAAASCSFHDRCGCFVMFPAAVAGLSVALEARRRPGGDDGGGKYGRHVGGLGGRSRRHKVGPAGTRGDSCHSLVAKLSSEKGCVLYTAVTIRSWFLRSRNRRRSGGIARLRLRCARLLAPIEPIVGNGTYRLVFACPNTVELWIELPKTSANI